MTKNKFRLLLAAAVAAMSFAVSAPAMADTGAPAPVQAPAPDTPPTIDDFFVEEKRKDEGANADEGDQAAGDPNADPDIDDLADIDADDADAAADADIPPPPTSWSKEDAEAWKSLTPEAREVVMRREKDVERFVTNKGREVAETKRQAQQEALQQVAQHAEQYAAQVQAMMQHFQAPPPDPRLLYSDDPNAVLTYQRQDAAHRASLAQQQELLQQAAQAQQQAEMARQQAFQAQTAAEAQRLQETLPEFFDPEQGPKLRQQLESIGQDLGYPPELMAQAGANDILALKKAADWKDKAAKYDKIVAKRMETARAAKGLPKVTRPGQGASQQAMQMADDDQRSAAIQQFERDRSADAAAALLFTRTR